MTVVKLSEVVNPWPRQKEFLDATRSHEYTLFGGAAGPGKSYILRWWLVDLLLKWAAEGHLGVRVGLFCEDYPALRDRHLSKVRTDFPLWLGRLNETQHEFRLHPHYGGGVLAFRNLDRPEKYQSVEFAAIAVDELTQNQRETFDVLRARKRWPGISFSPFAAATNPGGIGHVWVKQLWVDRDFSGDDSRLDPDTFAFIPARAGDNPALPESYITTLNTLPEKLRKAFLLGDWNIFVGQFFDEWDESLHVVKPFEIPKEWPRWCAIDYGNAAPMCCLWFARSPDKTIYVYRELYATRLTDVDQAKAILKLSGDEHILAHYADPSMWSTEPNGLSIASVYIANHVPHLTPANNDRRSGWLRLREVLKVSEATGKPRLQVFSTCSNLIRTLPGLVHDNLDVEDVDTDGEDHAPDACLPDSTRISTPDGGKWIRDIRIGDLVDTPIGPRRVTACGQTSPSDQVLAVYTDSGVVLRGTANHPVYVQGRGFVPLDTLRYGDIMVSAKEANECPLILWSLTESPSDVTPIRRTGPTPITTSHPAIFESKAWVRSIKRFGRACTALFRKGVTSTTKTKTHSTMTSATLRHDSSLTTFQPTALVRPPLPNAYDTLLRSDHLPLSGTDPMKGERGIAQTVSSFGSQLYLGRTHANCADSNSKVAQYNPFASVRIDARQSGDEIVARTTKIASAFGAVDPSVLIASKAPQPALRSVLSVTAVKWSSREAVYNLTVEDAHCYFADGILVHNCRYGVNAEAVPVLGKPKTPYSIANAPKKPATHWAQREPSVFVKSGGRS